MGYDFSSLAVSIPTFPGNKGLHQSSRTFRPLKMWTIRCLKTSESIYPLTQHQFFGMRPSVTPLRKPYTSNVLPLVIRKSN